MQGPDRYTLTAIVLHWVIALLIFIQFGLGWYMVGLPKGPDRSYFFALHKSIGLTVFVLAVMRLGWRLTHKPPLLPVSMERWRRELARRTHLMFYILMFLQPITGYLSASFSGYKTSYFGIPLPHWGWEDKGLNELFTDLHVASSIMLLVLIIVHVLGALWHALTPGDSVVRRMLPHRGALGVRKPL